MFEGGLVLVMLVLQSAAAADVPDAAAQTVVAVEGATSADIALYETSLTKPGFYAVCKDKDPGLSAAYEKASQDWMSRNRESIARGRTALRDEAKRSGMDRDNMLRDNATWTVSDFARKSRYALLTACEDMLKQDRKSG
jgi:hypothetical protein